MGEKRKIALFAGIDNCKFRRPVLPGDQIRLECNVTGHRGMLWKVRAEASVDGVLAAQADLTASLIDRPVEGDSEGGQR